MCDVTIIVRDAADADGEPPAKKYMKQTIPVGSGFRWNLKAVHSAAEAVKSGGKSPVSALNELGLTVTYTMVNESGPAHCPNFVYTVEVAGMKFEGVGLSKREARASAARACLAALLAKVGRVLPDTNQNNDFTCDDFGKEAFKTQLESLPKPLREDKSMEPTVFPDVPVTKPLFGHVEQPTSLPKSPINLLYESYPGLFFTCTYGDGTSLEDTTGPPATLGHSMRYKVICQIKDIKCEGYGSSKKLAKLAAARSAIALLGVNDAACIRACQEVSSGADTLPQTLADHIGKLVNEKFNELMQDDPIHSKRKVLAGIVITTNLSIENARVIAVTTGTKCVSGEHMSVRGRAVNDCHAEVASRRCLQKHFYEQLLQYAQSDDPSKTIESSDLQPIPGGGYQLKPSRHIHLYVSTAPCGDGRIFSPHESSDANDKHPNRLARGQLRTKIESGEGTIPVKKSTNVVQTWDGVLQGERLLTMSCSDKVARWCVIGLQGALLSHLMKPVYLHSLVLGSLLHPHHMYRALCGRIENHLARLPQNYTLCRPLLARAASTEGRTPQRAPTHSVFWWAHSQQENKAEVLNATTGKLENGQPSLLCKQSMFARWQYLVKRLSPITQETETGVAPVQIPPNAEELLYSEAKQLGTSYQAAKTCLIEAFDRAQLGRWIKKPLEQDQFTCELLDADVNALFA